MKISPASIFDPIPGLSPDFRYPIGYFEHPDRVTDRELLESFDEIFHPYVIRCADGSAQLHGNAPVAIMQLKNGRCPNLLALQRYLEMDGFPDEQMESTYNFEELTYRACNLSEGGHHGVALAILSRLPDPFHETADALESRVRSLKALGNYEEAMPFVEKLIAAPDVKTEYARNLFRIVRAEILVLLDRVDEARDYLLGRRTDLCGMYTYYGVMSAIALKKGEAELARNLVAKAGIADAYHAFKILWNPALRGIAPFIISELLTEAGEPKRSTLDSEGVMANRIADWSSAHEFFLALIGLGRNDDARRLSHVLPGCHITKCQDSPEMIRAIADLSDGVEFSEDEWIEKMRYCKVEAPLALAFRALASKVPLSYSVEQRIVEVTGKWRDSDRDLWVMSLQTDGSYGLWLMHEPRRRRTLPSGADPRDAFRIITTEKLDSQRHAAAWIEAKLEQNLGVKFEMHSSNPYQFEFNGWALLRVFREDDLTSFPNLLANWRIASADPNFYFSNGTLFSYGMSTPYAERVYQALLAYLTSRSG